MKMQPNRFLFEQEKERKKKKHFIFLSSDKMDLKKKRE